VRKGVAKTIEFLSWRADVGKGEDAASYILLADLPEHDLEVQCNISISLLHSLQVPYPPQPLSPFPRR